MTQSLIDDAGCAPEAGLRRLEGEVQHLREQVKILQALVEEEESSAYALPPRRRHSHPVKLYVLAGGLAAVLFGASPVLPVGNPIRQAVDYTVAGLIDQMPNEIPDPPDLNLPGSASTIVLGNPDGQHQPLHPVAAVRQSLNLPTPSTNTSQSSELVIHSMRPSPDEDRQVSVSNQPESSSPTTSSSPTSSSSPPPAEENRHEEQRRHSEPTASVIPAPTASFPVPVSSANLAPLLSPKPEATSSPKPKPTKTPQPTPTPSEEATTSPSPHTNKGKGKPPKDQGKPQASPQPSVSP